MVQVQQVLSSLQKYVLARQPRGINEGAAALQKSGKTYLFNF